MAQALEDLRIFYYEEPVHPLNIENYAEVKKSTRIPIASGERIYTRQGYRPFFERRLLDVIQPDLCLCGGLSEAKKICDMAWVYDSAVQIEAAIPNFLIHEHHQRALNPESRATCVYDYQPVDGYYSVPDLPGLGQALTPETIQRCKITTIKEARRFWGTR